MDDMWALKKWNQIIFITPWWQVAVQVHPQWNYVSHLKQLAKWKHLYLKYVSFTFAWQKPVFIHVMNFSCIEEPLAQKCPLREMSCFASFELLPTNRCFHSCSILFFCKWDGCEKGGMGCTSIYSAIHFIPLRGLDFNGETKVIGLYIIPKYNKKLSKQPNHVSTILQTDVYSQNLLLNFLFAHWQAFTDIWSCSSKSVIPAAVEQQGIYRWVQYGRRTVFVLRIALKKHFAHLMYFLPILSSVLL